ncbi:MAG: hypothetical protein ACU84Q_18400 [Gammaproteobacteria bacterium]
MSTQLPEVTEKQAEGCIADIYHDIRATLAIPNVNLIYRYFATIDGALPKIWRFLRPYFVSGEVAEVARKTSSLIAQTAPVDAPIEPFKRTDKDRNNIIAILDFYLRANPMNLCALQMLVTVLEKSETHDDPASPLLAPDTLKQSLAAMKFDSVGDELMFAVAQGARYIRPTLLRQLQQWPQYLDTIAPFVRSCCVSAEFFAETNTVYQASLVESRMILKDKHIALAPGAENEVLEFCRYFPIILIRMTILARSLRNSIAPTQT